MQCAVAVDCKLEVAVVALLALRVSCEMGQQPSRRREEERKELIYPRSSLLFFRAEMRMMV